MSTSLKLCYLRGRRSASYFYAGNARGRGEHCVVRVANREIMMKIIHRALIALTLLTGSFALAAQGRDHGRGHDDHHGHDRRHDNDRHRGGDRYHDRRYSSRDHDRHWGPPIRYGRDHRYYGPSHRVVYRYPAPRYVTHHDRWYRGHRYYGPNYVVSNYGYYRLRPPPRGYHWVRADNNYLLVAIATGVILDIALH